MTRLGDLCEFRYGKSLPAHDRRAGPVPVYGSNGVVGFHDEAISKGRTIIVGRKGSIGEVNLSAVSCWPIDTTYYIDSESSEVEIGWLSRALATLRLSELNKAAAVPGLNRGDAYEKRLFVPSLDEQRRIAAILDKADALRQKRKRAIALLDSLTQSIFLEMFGDPLDASQPWRTATLAALGRVHTGKTPPTSQPELFVGNIPFVTPGDLEVEAEVRRVISSEGARYSKTVPAGSALVCCIGATIGKMGIAKSVVGFNQQINAVEWGPKIDGIFGISAIRFLKPVIVSSAISTTLPILKKSEFEKLSIIVPDKSLQVDFASRATAVEVARDQALLSASTADTLFNSLQHRAFSGQL